MGCSARRKPMRVLPQSSFSVSLVSYMTLAWLGLALPFCARVRLAQPNFFPKNTFIDVRPQVLLPTLHLHALASVRWRASHTS